MVADAQNKVILSLGGIYLIAVLIVLFQRFSEESFGFIGFLSWIVVIAGFIYFVGFVISRFV